MSKTISLKGAAALAARKLARQFDLELIEAERPSVADGQRTLSVNRELKMGGQVVGWYIATPRTLYWRPLGERRKPAF